MEWPEGGPWGFHSRSPPGWEARADSGRGRESPHPVPPPMPCVLHLAGVLGPGKVCVGNSCDWSASELNFGHDVVFPVGFHSATAF